MKTKTFLLRFRYRDARNELFDATERTNQTSIANAKETGRFIAEQRAVEYAGKYWFMSAEAERAN